jgi:hypothetical protein
LEQLLQRPSTFEQKREGYEGLARERIVYLGHLAISSEVLGINDPLSHIFQYLDRGEEALEGIMEDLETDVAERLPITPFVNHVGFEFTGDDFVSVKDRVSMKSMTTNNLRIFAAESVIDSSLSLEYARARIESLEVSKLADWFIDAPTGALIVFESLPIGNQKIAVSRIYRKDSNSTVTGSFVSLYNPSLQQFNNLRSQMSDDLPECSSELEILSNHYEFFNPQIDTSENFVGYYVGVYDRLLSERDGKHHSFGLEVESGDLISDGLAKVRSQSCLTSVYVNTIKVLVNGAGKVDRNLLQINNSLGTGFELVEGQRLTVNLAQKILARVISGIVSIIDRAGDIFLDELSFDNNPSSSYEAVSYFGGLAIAAGESYSSNGCPEFGRTANEAANGSEQHILDKVFHTWGNLEDFGKPKIGVCRVSGCPSHGEYRYIHNRTLVGGCDVCVNCHKLFKQGKSPDKIYAEQQKKAKKLRTELEKVENNKKSKNEEQETSWNHRRLHKAQTQRKSMNEKRKELFTKLNSNSKTDKSAKKSESRPR